MRSIIANYREIKVRNPDQGSYLCLEKAIRSKRFSRKSLLNAFKEVMPSDEYAKDEIKGLIDYLEESTNLAEEGEK
jgi:hypothetical protein